MSVLPIVDRELRVAARRPGIYWMRTVAAGAVLLIWLLLLNNTRSISPGQMGLHLLYALGIIALLFSMLAGVFLTSDCLSEEKREGTLGLLFLTDLKAYDVVFGKLAAHSLHAFFGLMAIFPILGLTLLIGGVTGQEFGRLMLVFLTTLFFSLSAGMCVSALSHDARRSFVQALLVVTVLAGVFPALWWIVRLLFDIKLNFLLLPCPVATFINAFDSEYRTGTGMQNFWQSITTLFLLGVSGLVIANFVLPRSWQQTAEVPVTKSAANGKKWFVLSKPAPPRLPRGLLAPMFWLAIRDAAPRIVAGRLMWLIVPVWAMAMCIAATNKKASKEAFITAFFTAFALHVVLKIMIMVEAARRMNQDRRSGAWELLLVTPLPVEAILSGQSRALKNLFARAMLILVLLNLTMIAWVFLFKKTLDMHWQDQALFTEMFFGGVVVLVSDFFGISWVGMWRGLKVKQHNRAVLQTMLQLLVPSWVMIFLLIFLQVAIRTEQGIGLLMAFWFAAGIFISVQSARVARKRLLQEFRATLLAGSGL